MKPQQPAGMKLGSNLHLSGDHRRLSWDEVVRALEVEARYCPPGQKRRISSSIRASLVNQVESARLRVRSRPSLPSLSLADSCAAARKIVLLRPTQNAAGHGTTGTASTGTFSPLYRGGDIQNLRLQVTILCSLARCRALPVHVLTMTLAHRSETLLSEGSVASRDVAQLRVTY